MAELSALRARLKDRQVKAGALGTTDMNICLNVKLIKELADLEEQQAQWELDHPTSAPGSLAGKSVAPVNPVDAEIDAKQNEIRDETIIVVFQALASDKYQSIVNHYDDPDDKNQAEWLEELMGACYFEAWSEGEKVDLEWSDIRPGMGFGELAEAREKVWALNRRKADIPFSSRPSKVRRPLAATPKPA